MLKTIVVILIYTALLCTGCNYKSLYQLEKESLESGIRNDSIINGLRFGMGEYEVYKVLGWTKPSEGTSLDIEGLKKYSFDTYPAFYNDSLYSISFCLQNNPEYIDVNYNEIISILKNQYGEYSFKQNDSYFKKIIWLRGNLEIRLMCFKNNLGNPDGCDIFVINYSDLSKRADFLDFSPNELIKESTYSSDSHLPYYPDENVFSKNYLQKRKEPSESNYILRLEQESLASGKHHTTIFENVSFNMNELQVLNALEVRSDGTYTFDLEGLRKCKFVVTPYTFNDSIKSLVFFAYSGGELGEYMNPIYSINTKSAINAFTSKYGRPAYASKGHAIWLDGNLKIEIKGNIVNGINTLRIEFSDLKRKVTDVDLLSGRIINYENIYQTFQYSIDSRPMDI